MSDWISKELLLAIVISPQTEEFGSPAKQRIAITTPIDMSAAMGAQEMRGQEFRAGLRACP